jgi:hypothetical protein
MTPSKAKKYVWTTFSSDQIDLNYHSEKVLLKMIDILLFYVRKGADLIRLDAISYLWEEIGTRCVHLSQTHTIVQLFRDVLDCVAPNVALVTETNVPHMENIEYFETGGTKPRWCTTSRFRRWYCIHSTRRIPRDFSTGPTLWKRYRIPPTFLNFLDSHDGIGVLPVQDLLPSEAIDEMGRRIKEHGGYISYRTDGEGNEQPYELNSTWFSALNDPNANESLSLQVDPIHGVAIHRVCHAGRSRSILARHAGFPKQQPGCAHYTVVTFHQPAQYR